MNKKVLGVGLAFVAAATSLSLLCVNTNFHLLATDFAPYTCYLGPGEIEIRELIQDGENNQTYSSRGTVTKVSYNGTNKYRFYVQRTNGDDGTKSATILWDCDKSLGDNSQIKEGNVVSFSGVWNTSYKNLQNATLTKISDTNECPVEPLVFDSVTDFYNYPWPANAKTDWNRLVTVKNVKLTDEISNTVANYNNGIRKTRTNSPAVEANDTSCKLGIFLNGFSVSETTAIRDRLNEAYTQNASVDITGFVEKYTTFNVTITSAQDIRSEQLGNHETKSFKIYATNDFHGAVDTNMGIEVLGSFMKARSEDDNTVLIDSGDTWQGSIYSNYNKGKMITDVMNYAHYDARTIGNHDFDWGIETIKTNGQRSYNGYTVPTLGANLYDYDFDTKTVGTTFQSDYVQKSIIKTLENGLKVGIVGVIGQDQITSILTSNVKNVTFIDHVQVIKDEATALRAAGADVVIASIHADQNSVLGNDLNQYIDVCLCAHTHRFAFSNEESLLYAQYGNNGKGIGEITVTYDTETKKATSSSSTLYAEDVTSMTTIDQTVHEIVTSYKEECQAEADVVVANNVSGTFRADLESGNLMAKALYETAHNEGYNVVMSLTNQARADSSGPQLTYGDLYAACPFDNVVYMMTFTGKDIQNIPSWVNSYIDPNQSTEFGINEEYLVAVIDYLGEHTNSSRNYDYFPNSAAKPHPNHLQNNYRVTLKNWLIANGYNTGKALNSDDFLSSLPQHTRTQFRYVNGGSSTKTITDYNLVYSLFDEGTTDTYLNSPCGLITINHSPIVINSKYGEYGFDSRGYMSITLPAGYVIKNAEVKIYNTYDNVNFYKDGEASDENALTEYRSEGSRELTYTFDEFNSRKLLIQSSYQYTVYFYYINLTVAAV